jgi:hypothetical protein
VNFSKVLGLVFAAATLCFELPLAEANEPNLLRCELMREANLIRCEVLADGVAVTDAAVNGGKCRSPALVYEYNLRIIRQMTASDAAGAGDFRRTYDKGQSFSLYVDKACAVYEYSVTANDGARPFRGN